MANTGNSDASLGADLDGCGLVLVYATFPDEVSALNTGRSLVEAKLAGCINVLPSMTSIYSWQGKTETAREAVLIAKTRPEFAGRVTDAIKAQHSYEVPAILVIPVMGGNSDYLAWLHANTEANTGPDTDADASPNSS